MSKYLWHANNSTDFNSQPMYFLACTRYGKMFQIKKYCSLAMTLALLCFRLAAQS